MLASVIRPGDGPTVFSAASQSARGATGRAERQGSALGGGGAKDLTAAGRKGALGPSAARCERLPERAWPPARSGPGDRSFAATLTAASTAGLSERPRRRE